MNAAHDPVVIVSASRTPLGGFLGALSSLTAPQLGAAAITGALDRSAIDAALVDEAYMGCVLPAGQGQAPARQAALAGGLPRSCGATTVSKVCGSGMKAVMLAHDSLLAGSAGIAVAGGMESMSNAPYLLGRARAGYRLGHERVIDHMFMDGLEDAYADRGTLMGVFAEQCADEYGFDRDTQDAWAMRSLLRAREADASGAFEWEIAPLEVAAKGRGEAAARIASDEPPRLARPEKIASLKPAFRRDGTVTAANASSISDGAAALLLMRASRADALGLTPLARIAAHATHAGEPKRFPMAPAFAIRDVIERSGWRAADVDLYEINEAFAVVTLAAISDLALDPDTVNVHGGACALGHPIGATGARLLVTLLGALRHAGGRRGVASLCIGGGEATAVALELWRE
ncbi:MAG: acetyl-CoA C-acyltransferase [Gammaproteobacteria bacterium]|jgi:acetyl-CoA C-acetyltransferase|nr:acetyl-CoA C-acyltransferase [Gammaproteobacteria bacterium]MBU0770079.1 acetyl-CoA C-acyltransferase [Gammaproteobacteria bacterium]MBU0855612.1 acetyl-CoA C-acyltransferase [Gammaproteobacteria bacterium]MBU1848528.1 acetyl-CoA C-acyltransferase [Gammaproteobacteria bacterium]